MRPSHCLQDKDLRISVRGGVRDKFIGVTVGRPETLRARDGGSADSQSRPTSIVTNFFVLHPRPGGAKKVLALVSGLT